MPLDLEKKRARNRESMARRRRDPAYLERRCEQNADYYQRLMANPAKRSRRAALRVNWHKANRLDRNAAASRYYESKREEIIFKNRVWTLLMRVRRAEIKRGRVPYDG